MTNQPNPSPNNDSRRPNSDEDDISIPIGAIIKHWWSKRATFLVLFLTGGVAAILLAMSLYVLRPISHQSVLRFQLLFDGVEKGTYPNGTRFSPSDVLATSIVEKVYERNELARFVKFDDFKNGLVIMASNPELDRLQRAYADQLAARALTTVERQKIETEYAEKTAALKNSEFTLVTNFGSRFAKVPESLAAKAMKDALDCWAEQAKDRGIFKYDLNILSGNVLPANTTDDDYLIVLDRLRISITRIRANIEDLLKIPGADLLRVGPKNVSLGELRVVLDDMLTYRVGTIDSSIIQNAFYRNKTLSAGYLNEQIFRHKLSLDELNAQTKIIDDVQTNYKAERNGVSNANSAAAAISGSGGPMITQLSDTFIDRVMALSERSSDVAFRQSLANRVIAIQNQGATITTEIKLYQRQLDALGEEIAVKSDRNESKQWVEKQLGDILGQLKEMFADVQTFNATLSRSNLEPSTLYNVIGPVRAQTVSSISVITIVVLSLLLGMSIVGVGTVVVTWRGLQRE